MSAPLLSVIATINRRRLLDRTLASIANCAHPDGYQGAFIVENGRRAGAEELALEWNRRFPVTYIYLDRPSKSAALNKVLSMVGETILYFHDDDIELHPDALMALAEAVEQATAPSFFGGPLRANFERTPPPWLMGYLPGSARGWIPEPEQIASTSGLCFFGANWAASADDLRAAGGFDEAYGPSMLAPGEETLIQRRLLQRGIVSRYVPGALASHYVPQDRCSPLWTLRRAYRHGVARTCQLRTTPPEPLSSLPQREPQPLYRRIVRRFATEVQSARDLPRLFFHALFVASERCGAIHGKLLRRSALRNQTHVSPSR